MNCEHENFFMLPAGDNGQPAVPVCTWCTKPITDPAWLAAHTCIRCEQLVPPVSRKVPCKRVPDRGPHEFPEAAQ